MIRQRAERWAVTMQRGQGLRMRPLRGHSAICVPLPFRGELPRNPLIIHRRGAAASVVFDDEPLRRLSGKHHSVV